MSDEALVPLETPVVPTRGRYTTYTPELRAEIVKALKAGATRQAAYERVSVGRGTFYDWLKRYPDFEEECEQAEAECEVNMTAILKKAATGYDLRTVNTITKTVFKNRTTRLPDGTTITEPVPLEEVTVMETVSKQFDWRAALEWLKRRRREEWTEKIDLKVERLTNEELLASIVEGLQDIGSSMVEKQAALRELVGEPDV